MSAFKLFVQNRRKLLLIIFIVLAVIAMLVPAVMWYMRVKQERLPVVNAIPQDAAVIALFNNTPETWKKIHNENELWKQLKGYDMFRQLDASLAVIDSLRNTSKEVSQIVQNRQFAVSVHLGMQSKVEFLFLLSLDDYSSEKTLLKFVEKQFSVKNSFKEESFENSHLYSAFNKEKQLTFWWYCKKGILAGSFSRDLLMKSYHQLHETSSLADNPMFQSVYNTAGKKVEINVFVNYPYLYKLAQTFIAPDFYQSFSFLSHFAAFSGFDMMIKPNELVLTGYTSVNDSLYNYLCSFMGQESPKLNVANILPQNTFFYADLGFDNFFIYYKEWKHFLEKSGGIESFVLKQKKNNTIYRVNIADKFIRWIGKEACLAYAPALNPWEQQYGYVLFDIADRDLMNTSINELVRAGYLFSGGTPDTSSIGEYRLNRIAITSLLPDILGSFFSDVKSPYVCVIENYVVMCSSKDGAEYFVMNYMSGKTLHNNSSYKSFSEHIDDKANISIYMNFKQQSGLFKKYFDPIMLQHIEYENVSLDNIEAMAIQFSLNKQMFYTNAYLKYEPRHDTLVSTLVKTQLDFDVVGPIAHDAKYEYFAAYDKGSNLYLIDAAGNIVFKKKIGDVLYGDIDFVTYKDNKYLFFNSERSLHLIDFDGEYAKGFPAKLAQKSSAGHTLANYGKNDEYRVLVPSTDKAIYNYNLEGKRVKEWKTFKCAADITKPVQVLLFNNKDFIIASDEKGKLSFLNRQGEKRLALKPEFAKSAQNQFYLDNEKKGQFLVTTELNGKVQKIDAKGGKQSLYFDDFSSSHFFIFADINGDGQADYIFVDKNEIKIFDNDKKVLLNEKMTTIPTFVQLVSLANGEKNLLVLIDADSKEALFYNNKGLMKLPSQIEAQQPLLVFPSQGHYKVMSVSKNVICQQVLDF
ncbi:MAG: hypothetical protein WCH34_15220 [Bacteroidota bacterium]